MSETEYSLLPNEDESREDEALEERPHEEATREEPVRYIPGQPLPRLWKAEPQPDEENDEAIEALKKKAAKDAEAAAAASASRSKAAAKPKKKKKVEDAPNGEKKVLIEETPTFDTIESRQRARLVIGGLLVFCLLIFGWIVKGMIFSGSGEFEGISAEMPSQTQAALPGPAPSREPEARYMLDRAREYAKRGQTELALDKLQQIVRVYRGTLAAAYAQAALDRPRQNLPLFPDGPYVLAEKAPEARPSAGPASPPPSTPGPGSKGSGAPPAPVVAPMPPPAPVAGLDPQRGFTPKADVPTVPGTGPSPGMVASSPPPGRVPNPGPAGPPAQPGPPSNLAPAGSPPQPGPGINPGTVAATSPAGPGPNLSSPIGPAPAPAPAMSPNVASTGPPPSPPGVGAGTNPSAPAPGSGGGPGQPAPAPPPGPGDAVVLIPGNNGGSNSATPPAGGSPNGGTAADDGTTIRGRGMRTLPPGFAAKPEAGVHESGWPMVIVGERDRALMVLVPGGTFTMGSDQGDPWNGPAHFVRLSTYYIDQHEVTNRQFRTFLDETHYHGQPPGRWLTDPKMRAMPDDAPAVFVSYQDAEEYAIWALKRLPTEAQWEMAARSIDGRRYPWGDEPVRWSRPRKLQQIDHVMAFSEDVSAYGVFDLAGNAVEWVRDWYDPAYYARSRDKTTLDPTGPPIKKEGIHRVVRGGSKEWLMYARQGMDSDRRSPYVGFRCSLAVEGGEASAIIAPHPPKPNNPQPGAPAPGQGVGNDVPF